MSRIPSLRKILLLTFLFAMLAAASSQAADDDPHRLGINVFGLSHHWDRELAHRNHADNELNWGLGVEYEFERTDRSRTFLDAGAYLDSGRNIAKFGGIGWQGRLGSSNFLAGGALVVFHSETYYNNMPFLAPVPLLTYEFKKASVTLFHFVKYENLNRVPVSGVFLTIPVAFGK